MKEVKIRKYQQMVKIIALKMMSNLIKNNLSAQVFIVKHKTFTQRPMMNIKVLIIKFAKKQYNYWMAGDYNVIFK